MNIFSKGPGKTEFIMKFVQAIMSQRRLVNFLMYCACNSGIIKHYASPDLVTEYGDCRQITMAYVVSQKFSLGFLQGKSTTSHVDVQSMLVVIVVD